MTTIRPATREDLHSLTTLLEILFTIEEDFQFDRKRQHHGLQMMLANHQACILVAESKKELVGMCAGQLLISTAEGGQSLLLEDVVVVEEHRRKGVGKLLIDSITEWAKAKHVSRLQLLADKNNQAALRFYENIGWQKTQLICFRKYI